MEADDKAKLVFVVEVVVEEEEANSMIVKTRAPFNVNTAKGWVTKKLIVGPKQRDEQKQANFTKKKLN